MPENTLYYGDNLDVLRRHIKDEAVDLVYLDPPFNSSRNYNVLFAEKAGHKAAAQIQAFEDTWQWDESAARQFEETGVISATAFGIAFGKAVGIPDARTPSSRELVDVPSTPPIIEGKESA